MKFFSSKKVVILIFILLFPSLLYIFLTTGKHNIMDLPVFGPRDVVYVEKNGEKVADTVYHTIPEFQFINQYGNIITYDTFKGKIYVADFIFTTCQGICPKMSNNLTVVQQEFIKDTNLLILSHTVDPEKDTVEALLDYAEKMNAKKGKWHFVTGEKKELYDIARNGYFVTALEGDGGAEDFIHSEKLILIDKLGRIRGFFDGTDPKEVERLIDEIKVLKASEHIPRKEKT